MHEGSHPNGPYPEYTMSMMSGSSSRFSARIYTGIGLVAAMIVMSCAMLHAQPDRLRPYGPPAAHEADSSIASPAAPVIFNNDTLFLLRARIGPFSAADRATAISQRLKTLAGDPLAHIDSLTVLDRATMTDVLAGDIAIMTVTDADAAMAGMPRAELAHRHAETIHGALERKLHDTSLRSILLGALFTLLATVLLIVVIKLLNRFFPKILITVDGWRGSRIRPLKIQNLELLPADRIADLLAALTKLARLGLLLLLFYIYLPLVLSFFPWTRSIATRLIGYVAAPLELIGRRLLDYLPNLFIILVIVVVSYYIIRLIRLLFMEIQRGSISLPGFYSEWADPTYKIVRFLILALVAVIIFPYLPGSDSPAFQGVGLFLTLLISLGSASAISNIISGVVLTYTRAFTVGDHVRIADTIGDVVEKTLLVTRIRTTKNVDITIPNSMVLGSHITNYSSSATEHGLVVHTSVTMGYDTPWQQVHELLIAAATGSEYILKEPAPFVLQTSLDDWYVAYELNAYTKLPGKMAIIYSDLHARIQDRFNEAGVELMSPHYQAVRDGNTAAMPPEHLPQDYASPGFKVFPFGNFFGKSGGNSSRSD